MVLRITRAMGMQEHREKMALKKEERKDRKTSNDFYRDDSRWMSGSFTVFPYRASPTTKRKYQDRSKYESKKCRLGGRK